jgi:hypothetical protein
VTYALYSTSTCTAASIVTTSTAAVSAGALGSSAPVTAALAPGKYYWAAAYSGNAANAPSASVCGSEVLTVGPFGSIAGAGSSTSATVTITVSCGVVPCTVTVTITVDPKKHKKPKTITLAKGKFTINKHGNDKLTIKLTSAGKRLEKKDHGKFKATVLIETKFSAHLEKVTGTVRFKPAKGKHH